jgi:uncharacterized protein (TIGR00255 family)
MTGFGDARGQTDRLSVSVEVRAVNNRYLKIVTKCPERHQALEPEIEQTVRESISRGTVNVAVRVDESGGAQRYRLDPLALRGYWHQLTVLKEELGISLADSLAPLLDLPGVVVENSASTADAREDWPVIEGALRSALSRFQEFRAAEGRSMQQDLQGNLKNIAAELAKIAALAPQVVRDFRDRLHERVKDLLKDNAASIESSDLIREVSIFAERCDISEEITRLRSHLNQFEVFVAQPNSQGRKLDFLTQEMVREVNTIGSKANNVDVAHAVVEIKSCVDRMREVLQNVE